MLLKARTYKVLLLPLLLAALLGQSLAAAALPCEAMGSHGSHTAPAEATAHHAAMDHSDHALPAIDATTVADCCQGASPCDMAACVALAAVPTSTITALQLQPVSMAIAGNIPLSPAPADSLFRPPISA